MKDVGDCDGIGKCKTIEVIMVRSCHLVCGCDGETHCASDVAKNGVNIKEYGACAVDTTRSSDVVAAAE